MLIWANKWLLRGFCFGVKIFLPNICHNQDSLLTGYHADSHFCFKRAENVTIASNNRLYWELIILYACTPNHGAQACQQFLSSNPQFLLCYLYKTPRLKFWFSYLTSSSTWFVFLGILYIAKKTHKYFCQDYDVRLFLTCCIREFCKTPSLKASFSISRFFKKKQSLTFLPYHLSLVVFACLSTFPINVGLPPLITLTEWRDTSSLLH